MLLSSSVFALASPSLKNAISYSNSLKYMWKPIYFPSANVFFNSYKNRFCTSITCRDLQSHQRAEESANGEGCYLQLYTCRQPCVQTRLAFLFYFSKQDRCHCAAVMKTQYMQPAFADPEHTDIQTQNCCLILMKRKIKFVLN